MDPRTFRVLSLFSGGGGLDLATKLAVPSARTVCYVENEAAACGVLVSRMQEARLDEAPVWTDVATFDGTIWRGHVDCVIGGFPCQDLSVAGKRKGLQGQRSGLWWEFHRVLQETNAPYAFIENVGAGAGNWLPAVRGSLWEIGYASVSVRMRASDVGAPHRRLRTFIFAYPECGSLRLKSRRGGWQSREEAPLLGNSYSVFADPSRKLRDRSRKARKEGRTKSSDSRSKSSDTKSVGQREPDNEARAESHTRSRKDTGRHDRKPADTKRKRLAKRKGKRTDHEAEQSAVERSDQCDADSNRRRCESEWGGWLFDRDRQTFRYDVDGLCSGCRYRRTPWAAESPVCRVDDGIRNRLDRLRLLGNAVVPQQAAMAFSFLIGRVRSGQAN